MKKDKDSSLPWFPTEYEDHHVQAMKALARGDCPEHLQKIALDWIINQACDTFGMSFRPDDMGGDRASNFAEGKRHVGNQIVKMIEMIPATLRKNSNKAPTEQGN